MMFSRALRENGRPIARPLAAVLVLFVLATGKPPRCAWGQSPIHRVSGGGELTLDLDRYRLGIADSLGWQRANIRSTLRIPIAGELLHENLARYTLNLRPTVRWLRSDSGGTSLSRVSRELGYDGLARFLSITRFPIAVQASRLAGSAQGDFGEHQDFDERYRGTDLTVFNAMLPLSVSLSEREFRDNWYPALHQSPLLRREQSSVARVAARNTKTSVLLEQSSFADVRTGVKLHISAQSFSHVLRWGNASYLTSTGNWNEFSGPSGYRRQNWSQRARIQHAKSVFSNTSYLLYSLGSERVTNRGRAESTHLLVQANRSFQFGLRASRSVVDFGAGNASMVSVGPTIAFERSIGRYLRLMGNAAVYRDWHQRHLTDRTAYIIDEPHMIDSSRRILLRRASVDISSFELLGANRATRYSRGADYQLFVTDAATEVIIIPGARISVGDTVRLTYAFLLPARQPAAGVSADYGASIVSGPLILYHRRTKLGAQSPAAVDFLGASSDENSTGVSLSWQRQMLRVDLSAEERRRQASGVTYWAQEERGSIAARVSNSTQALLAVSLNKSTAGRFRADAASLTGGVTWWAFPSLRFNAELRGWSWRPSDASSESLLGGSIGAETHVGLTDMALRIEVFARDFGGVPGRESRVVTRVVRRY